MDVNATKFHLLLGRADWEGCRSGQNGKTLGEIWDGKDEDKTPQFDWNEETNEITLRKHLFKFKTSPKDKKPDLINRRGAACDRYRNWYWIDETGLKIKVLSAGSNTVSDFYPVAAGVCAEDEERDFEPVETTSAPKMPVELHGLAVTIDHFLVVGTIEPAGLLIFDLFSTGEPRQIMWREDIEFVPFDITARFSGGVFVLDREHTRYWTLDRGFNAIGEDAVKAAETHDDFQPLDNPDGRKHSEDLPADKFFSELPPDDDPISIEALPDDTVLILNLLNDDDLVSKSAPKNDIHRYYRRHKLQELTTALPSSEIRNEGDSLPPTVRLRGFDIAFVKADQEKKDETDGNEKYDRLFFVSEEGNQAYSFRMICDDELASSYELPSYVVRKIFKLDLIKEYFPMRLFGGRGFTAADDGRVYFDFGERWLPLIKQNRPSFETFGILETPVFDSREPNCVWHRLMLDACISRETKVDVYCRTGNDKNSLPNSWQKKEPDLYFRGNGSEIPFFEGWASKGKRGETWALTLQRFKERFSKEKGKGTWELLLQRAKGRYLQLRFVFTGNGQQTPRISALRVYYPRFSYLKNYLPSIYREDEQSAFFLDGFLANFEGLYTTIEDKMALAQMLFDVRSAPPDTLDWLANWFGVVLDPAWTEDKRRLFISHAVEFFQYRGTLRGLRIALRLALDSCPDESIFDFQTPKQKMQDPIRIVERFLTRRTPEILPADFVEESNLPRFTQQNYKWTPTQGTEVLHKLYRKKFKKKVSLTFPLTKPVDKDEAVIWESFALETLGFVPSTNPARERQNWQNFLRGKYLNNIKSLNNAHAAVYKNFNEIFLPDGTSNRPALKADWRGFIGQKTNSSRDRELWQDFLARRYRRIGQFNSLFGTNWSAFEVVSLFDRLPESIRQLGDWIQFESSVLAMHRTAHRFTVLIPATLSGAKPETPEEQNRKLQLVKRVVDLEKPAHTICDFRYYWNLFRLEEVRLGLDTLLGLGIRDPQLNFSLIAGEKYVGESFLGLPQPEKYSSRFVIGSENLKKQKNKKEEKL